MVSIQNRSVTKGIFVANGAASRSTPCASIRSGDSPRAKADRTAREIKALRPDAAEAARHNIDPEALMKRLADHSRTTEKIRTTLETIHETRGNDVPRARVAALRSGGAPKSAKGQP